MTKTSLFKTLLLAITLTLTTVSANAAYSGTGTFTKISTLTDLTDGYYVIAYGTTFAMSNTNAGTYFGNTAITPTNNSIIDPASTIVWEVKNHVDGGRTIYNEASTKYASYTGTANAALAVASVTGGSERWTFAYTSSLFTITNVTSSTRLLQYNTSSPRFACYTGSQQNITLYKLQVAAIAPVVSDATPTGTVGSAFTYNISATNSPTSYAVASGTLPAGLSLITTTGAITGTPTTAGSSSVTVTATNAIGTSAAATLSFNIAKANQTITFAALDAKTNLDAAFDLTATASSGLVVSYVSSNTAVATIVGSTVTIVGIGSTDITASQAGNDNYNAATPVIQKLTVGQYVAPTITITEITVPTFVATIGNTALQTVNVAGVNLTANVSLALSGANADQFSLSQTSVAQNGGIAPNTVVTINYTPTVVGTHTATLTFSSTGAIDVTRTLSGTATVFTLDTPVATAATGISTNGFTANWNAVDGATEYQVDVTYEAAGGSGSTNILSENFSGFTAGTTGATADATDVAATVDTYAQTTGWSATKLYQAGGAVKIGSSSTLGNITTPSMNLSANSGNFTVSFKAMAWSGDSTRVKLYLNDVLVKTVGGLTNDANYTLNPFTANLTGGTATSKLKIEGNQAAKGRFFLDDLLIAQVGGGTTTTTLTGSPFTVTGATSKVFTGINPGTTYKYTVTAKNTNSTSVKSNVITVATTPTGLITPEALTVMSASNGSIKFTASANETVEIYNAIGQKLLQQKTQDGTNTIQLQNHGVLLVKVGNRIGKVIL